MAPEDQLQVLCAKLRAGVLQPAERIRLADVIAVLRSGAAPDLESAMGIVAKNEEYATRDTEIYSAVAHCLADSSEREQAKKISKVLNRYHATGWSGERHLDTYPGEKGTLREFAWRILKAKDRALSEEGVRAVLKKRPAGKTGRFSLPTNRAKREMRNGGADADMPR
jgi:hypothetical protein